MAELLARLAGNAFWAARYVERVENLARLLQVNDTAGRDALGHAAWARIPEINGDGPDFAERGRAPDRANVCHYYLFDSASPASATSALSAARANIRAVRHLISTELWLQINVFYNDYRKSGPERFEAEGLSALCGYLRFNCQTITGIVEGTLYREETYRFYALGRFVELADQTTRLLDVVLRGLEAAELSDGEARAHWQAVLRSAGGYHAFRRTRANDLTRTDVARFLLKVAGFPRSLAAARDGIENQLHHLSLNHGLHLDPETMEALDALRVLIAEADPAVADLRNVLDAAQLTLIALTNRLGRAYFDA